MVQCTRYTYLIALLEPKDSLSKTTYPIDPIVPTLEPKI